MADAESGAAAVTDRRVAPRGVLPRNTQMWLMVGLATVIVGIIVFAGHPQPTSRSTPAMTTPPPAPSADRLREYQDRLRVLDERARQEAAAESAVATVSRPTYDQPVTPAPSAAASDPIREDRKRREYESLFSSNVVMSRRPDGQQLIASQATPVRAARPGLPPDASAAPPNIDDVADAVVRATTRYAPTGSASLTNSPAAVPGPAAATPTGAGGGFGPKPRPAATGPITSTGPLHRVLEGTMIDTVLTNRLDGSVAAPVNCLVTNPVYSHDGQYVLIPAGSRVLGETKPVPSFGETRLAVAFNRLALPDGRTYPLEQFLGLNDIGDAGLRDQVNQHYRSTFGASAAVGLITGFAQYLGTMGFGGGSGDRTVVIAGNVGESTAQATSQTMNRFLNRLPNITIREGHRVKVYLTSDLELPAYEPTGAGKGGLLARSR